MENNTDKLLTKKGFSTALTCFDFAVYNTSKGTFKVRKKCEDHAPHHVNKCKKQF